MGEFEEQVIVSAAPEKVWDALADIGNIHIWNSGVVHSIAKAFDLSNGFRPSEFLTSEAVKRYNELKQRGSFSLTGDIESVRRRGDDLYGKPILAQWLDRHPANIEATRIGDVETDVISPEAGIAPANAVCYRDQGLHAQSRGSDSRCLIKRWNGISSLRAGRLGSWFPRFLRWDAGGQRCLRCAVAVLR